MEIHLTVYFFDAATSILTSLFFDAGQDNMANDTINELWTKLSIFKKGVRRRCASKNQEHGLTISEGKMLLSYQA